KFEMSTPRTSGRTKRSVRGRVESELLRICYAQGVTVWGFGIIEAQEVERAGRGLFHELCEVLSEVTGISFRPVITTGYRELAGSLERGDVGLAWLPPIPTTDLQSRGLTTVLAIPSRHGTTSYHSALIVRRGGPRTVADLKGRRAVWVQRDSAAG